MTLRRAWLIAAACLLRRGAQFRRAQRRSSTACAQRAPQRNSRRRPALSNSANCVTRPKARPRQSAPPASVTPSPKEACGLFNVFTAAEAKMLKYAIDNATWCGIPPQM